MDPGPTRETPYVAQPHPPSGQLDPSYPYSRPVLQRHDTICTMDSQDYIGEQVELRGVDSCIANYEPRLDRSWEVPLMLIERPASRASTLIDRPLYADAAQSDAKTKVVSSDGAAGPSALEREHPLYIARTKGRYLPPLFLVGPAIAVLLLTAGLATIMVLWIHFHRLPIESEGVMFVREGIEDEPDRPYTDPNLGTNNTLRFNTQIAHSTGLSFSTIISTLVGLSVYPLMSLIAYSLATDWLILQSQVAESPSVAQREKLPTPMQYALLLQLCSGQSLEAIWNTMRHIFFHKGSRASVPSLLKKAVTWLIVLVSVNVAIAWTDFWLHETVKMVQVVHVDPAPTMRSYGMKLNDTLCAAQDGVVALPCLVTVEEAGSLAFALGSEEVERQARLDGALTFQGMSTTYEIADLGEREEATSTDRFRYRFSPPTAARGDAMVFVTSPEVTNAQIFRIPTLGLEGHCEVFTASCNSDPASFDCSNVGHPGLASRPDADPTTQVWILPPSQADADAASGEENIFQPVNPLQLEVLVSYANHEPVNLDQTGFQALERGNRTWTYAAASCNMSAYQLDLDYFNGSFSLLGDKMLAPADVAYQLSGPLMAGRVGRLLTPALSDVAMRVNSTIFGDELAYALSFTSLSEAAGLLSPVEVPVLESEQVLASQYPIAPLYFYFTLLYSYALIAIVLFFWAWCSSSDSITYNCPIRGQKVQIPAATLAQKVLMDPSRLIAMYLGGSQAPTLAPAQPSGVPEGFPGSAPGHDESQEKVDTTYINRVASTSIEVGSDQTSLRRRELGREAVLRTTATDLLGLFDESVHQERLVVGLESNGRGFGVWPLSQAAGAVGQDDNSSSKRDSLVRATNLFHPSAQHRQQHHRLHFHPQYHHPHPQDPHQHPLQGRSQHRDFSPAP
ncbi:hypothetical protein ACQY0O_005841 [Thecaphora frezii]